MTISQESSKGTDFRKQNFEILSGDSLMMKYNCLFILVLFRLSLEFKQILYEHQHNLQNVLSGSARSLG